MFVIGLSGERDCFDMILMELLGDSEGTFGRRKLMTKVSVRGSGFKAGVNVKLKTSEISNNHSLNFKDVSYLNNKFMLPNQYASKRT